MYKILYKFMAARKIQTKPKDKPHSPLITTINSLCYTQKKEKLKSKLQKAQYTDRTP